MNSSNSWKMKARTGGIRRKLSKEYQRIMKTEENKPSSREVTQSVTKSLKQDGSVHNFNRNSSEDVAHSTNYVCPSFSSSNLGDNINCSILNSGYYNSKISSSEDDDDGNYSDDVKHLLFREKIRTWAIEKSINHVALKDLAAIINGLIPKILPTDPRTILATPRNVNIKEIEGGEYWHNGIANSLIKILNSWNEAPDEISLNINFDGLPIFKSSKHEFWPILCNIHEKTDIKPFIIGIYFGVGKPKNLDSYLEDFIKDMKKVLDEGIHTFEKTITVKIRCFICDSPARAYIKGVCNFNGKHGCLKCVTIGEYSHNSHTVTFSDIDCAERTNEGFRNKLYGPHHKTNSPLLGLPIDMVKDFPVGDSLHLLDLGIMKRLLVGWRDGNFGKYITKWRASDIETVSIFLRRCKLPSEIHRAVRALDTLAYWKASEFRSFFYYLSVIILPEVLKSTAYSHFLTLYCGIIICSSEAYQNMLPVADKLLKHFVRHYRDFYGADYVTSNVHNLIHVTVEVTMYGPLQSFNAYPFENQLYMIKKMLRVGRNPLSQVAKRLAELNLIDVNKNITQNNSQYPFVKTSKNGRKILHMKEYKLSSKTCDRYILTNNNDIIEIKFIIDESDVLVHGIKIQNKIDIFTYPVKSSRFGIYKATSSDECANAAVILDLREIKCKLVCINHKECNYFIPLLHTL